MTYDEFKTYIVKYLWKVGDQYVIDNLDVIILTAESELGHKLHIPDREGIAKTEANDNFVSLPPDYKSARTIYSPTIGEMKYVVPSVFTSYLPNAVTQPVYTLEGKYLLINGNVTVDYPFPLWLIYSRKLPQFKRDGQSWIVDEYFDLYLYSVLKHTAPFLKNDERLPVWAGLSQDALDSINDDAAQTFTGGSPGLIRFPAGVR